MDRYPSAYGRIYVEVERVRDSRRTSQMGNYVNVTGTVARKPELYFTGNAKAFVWAPCGSRT